MYNTVSAWREYDKTEGQQINENLNMSHVDCKIATSYAWLKQLYKLRPILNESV